MAERGTTSSEQPRPWQSYNTVYTNAKAGMDGIDKEKVQRIVYEMSKGSKYFENEERKEAETRQKIERMRAQCAKLSSVELLQYQMIADKRVLELEATRDLSKLWLHVDMDAFYAAVETLSDPSLKGKPMAVGSMSMISTANYEARRYGVRAAMPGFIARKLCPELIFVPTDFKKYTYYTELARKVFQKYDPKFFAASLDEAYLDITEVCKERGNSGAGIAEELRTAVFEVSGLTCSAGVAPNRLLAKVCSDINKPNGQYVLPNDRTAVMAFTSSLPIRKIGGIGKVTEHILRDVFGIKTCEDMLQKGGYCFALFSRGTADFFLSVGLGLGQTKAPQVSLRKSISNERTFSATDDEILLYKKLAELAELLSADMQKEGLHGRTLTLKLKTAAFEVRTRAITLQKYICSTEDILKYASNLLKSELPVSLRLIGLRASQFKEEKYGAPTDPTQKTLLNFVSGDASRKLQSSLCSDSSDHTVMNDTEADFSVDGQVLFHSEYRSHMDLYENDNTLDEATDDTSGQSSHQLDKAKISGADSSSPCCIDMDTPQKKKIEEGNYVIGRDEITSPSPSPSHLAEELTWINGYKCSVCGTELPPSFVEERKEHFDFHIAEKLQKEEESVGSRILTPSPRLARKEPSATRRKSKKHRSSSSKVGGHVPIDLFFGKINK